MLPNPLRRFPLLLSCLLSVAACASEEPPAPSDEASTTDTDPIGGDSTSTGLPETESSESSGGDDVLPEAVLWEVEIPLEPREEWGGVYGLATSPSGDTYVLASSDDSHPTLIAFDVNGQHEWSYELAPGEIRGATLRATNDFIIVGIVTDVGAALGGDYRYTLLTPAGERRSGGVDATSSNEIGVAQLGSNFVVASAVDEVEIMGGTTAGTRVEAFRVGEDTPAWSWVRQGGISLPADVLIADSGSIFVTGRAGEPNTFATSFNWVGKLSSNGTPEWERRLDVGNDPTLTMSPSGDLHLTSHGATFVLSTDGEPIEAIELEGGGGGGRRPPSWRGDSFLLAREYTTDPHGVTGYTSDGEVQWTYTIPGMRGTHAAFVDDDSFTVAGSHPDKGLVVQRVRISLL